MADRPLKGRGSKRGDPPKEGFIQHVAEVLETRFLTAGQVATATTSAEVNLASAALEAIEGPAATAAPEARNGRPARRARQKPRRKKSPRS